MQRKRRRRHNISSLPARNPHSMPFMSCSRTRALIRAGGTLTVRHSYPGTILLMPVLLYFLLLCKSSKERCPRPLFGAKASAKVRTSPETAKHFRHIFSIFFPENTGIYPLQPEKSTPHGKNNPPRLQNGPISKACLLKFEI